MISFSATVDGVPEFDRAFNRIGQIISDFRSIWPEVAQAFYRIEVEQFESEGTRGASGRFTALSPAYAKFKAVKFPGKTILRATDTLFDSLTNPNAPGSVFRPEQSQLTLGTSVPYGVFHQRGTRRMPRRPPISMSEDQKRQIQKAIQIGLVQFMRRQGFSILENAA